MEKREREKKKMRGKMWSSKGERDDREGRKNGRGKAYDKKK